MNQALGGDEKMLKELQEQLELHQARFAEMGASL
jgi:hypothetical protein